MKLIQLKTKLPIAGVVLMLVLAPLTRVTQAQPQSDDTAKIKSAVSKRLTKKKTKVKVTLRTGEEVKGRLDQADDNGFTITQDKTNKQIQMSYADVSDVKGRGGLSTAAKIGIIAGIAVGVLVILAVMAVKNFDPFSGGITAR